MELLRQEKQSRGGERDKDAVHCIAMSPLLQNLQQNSIKTHQIVGTDGFPLETNEGTKFYTKDNVTLYE